MMSRLCKICAKPLTGKQQDFCSPKHNTEWHRKQHLHRSQHLSITAAAAELGISRHAISRAIRSRRLQAVQVPTAGRPRLELTRGELERYREARPVRRLSLNPEEVDAEIRRAVGEMARKVQDVARRCAR